MSLSDVGSSACGEYAARRRESVRALLLPYLHLVDDPPATSTRHHLRNLLTLKPTVDTPPGTKTSTNDKPTAPSEPPHLDASLSAPDLGPFHLDALLHTRALTHLRPDVSTVPAADSRLRMLLRLFVHEQSVALSAATAPHLLQPRLHCLTIKETLMPSLLREMRLLLGESLDFASSDAQLQAEIEAQRAFFRPAWGIVRAAQPRTRTLADRMVTESELWASSIPPIGALHGVDVALLATPRASLAEPLSQWCTRLLAGVPCVLACTAFENSVEDPLPASSRERSSRMQQLVAATMTPSEAVVSAAARPCPRLHPLSMQACRQAPRPRMIEEAESPLLYSAWHVRPGLESTSCAQLKALCEHARASLPLFVSQDEPAEIGQPAVPLVNRVHTLADSVMSSAGFPLLRMTRAPPATTAPDISVSEDANLASLLRLCRCTMYQGTPSRTPSLLYLLGVSHAQLAEYRHDMIPKRASLRPILPLHITNHRPFWHRIVSRAPEPAPTRASKPLRTIAQSSCGASIQMESLEPQNSVLEPSTESMPQPGEGSPTSSPREAPSFEAVEMSSGIADGEGDSAVLSTPQERHGIIASSVRTDAADSKLNALPPPETLAQTIDVFLTTAQQPRRTNSLQREQCVSNRPAMLESLVGDAALALKVGESIERLVERISSAILAGQGTTVILPESLCQLLLELAIRLLVLMSSVGPRSVLWLLPGALVPEARLLLENLPPELITGAVRTLDTLSGGNSSALMGGEIGLLPIESLEHAKGFDAFCADLIIFTMSRPSVELCDTVGQIDSRSHPILAILYGIPDATKSLLAICTALRAPTLILRTNADEVVLALRGRRQAFTFPIPARVVELREELQDLGERYMAEIQQIAPSHSQLTFDVSSLSGSLSALERGGSTDGRLKSLVSLCFCARRLLVALTDLDATDLGSFLQHLQQNSARKAVLVKQPPFGQLVGHAETICAEVAAANLAMCSPLKEALTSALTRGGIGGARHGFVCVAGEHSLEMAQQVITDVVGNVVNSSSAQPIRPLLIRAGMSHEQISTILPHEQISTILRREQATAGRSSLIIVAARRHVAELHPIPWGLLSFVIELAPLPPRERVQCLLEKHLFLCSIAARSGSPPPATTGEDGAGEQDATLRDAELSNAAASLRAVDGRRPYEEPIDLSTLRRARAETFDGARAPPAEAEGNRVLLTLPIGEELLSLPNVYEMLRQRGLAMFETSAPLPHIFLDADSGIFFTTSVELQNPRAVAERLRACERLVSSLHVIAIVDLPHVNAMATSASLDPAIYRAIRVILQLTCSSPLKLRMHVAIYPITLWSAVSQCIATSQASESSYKGDFEGHQESEHERFLVACGLNPHLARRLISEHSLRAFLSLTRELRGLTFPWLQPVIMKRLYDHFGDESDEDLEASHADAFYSSNAAAHNAHEHMAALGGEAPEIAYTVDMPTHRRPHKQSPHIDVAPPARSHAAPFGPSGASGEPPAHHKNHQESASSPGACLAGVDAAFYTTLVQPSHTWETSAGSIWAEAGKLAELQALKRRRLGLAPSHSNGGQTRLSWGSSRAPPQAPPQTPPHHRSRGVIQGAKVRPRYVQQRLGRKRSR